MNTQLLYANSILLSPHLFMSPVTYSVTVQINLAVTTRAHLLFVYQTCFLATQSGSGQLWTPLDTSGRIFWATLGLVFPILTMKVPVICFIFIFRSASLWNEPLYLSMELASTLRFYLFFNYQLSKQKPFCF